VARGDWQMFLRKFPALGAIEIDKPSVVHPEDGFNLHNFAVYGMPKECADGHI
jgi:hypothetical protein